MKLIGLSGAAGAGKDTVASMLLDNVCGHQRAFAAPLKAAAAQMFGLTREQMEDRELKEKLVPFWGKSPREILQLLGTECGRDVFGTDIWTKRADLTLEQILAEDRSESFAAEVLVWTDVRFADEAEWIHRHGGVVIEIRRSAAIPVGVKGHRSAAPLPAECVDWTIYNESSKEALASQVRNSYAAWLGDAHDLDEVVDE